MCTTGEGHYAFACDQAAGILNLLEENIKNFSRKNYD